jgi:hypothetical protein
VAREEHPVTDAVVLAPFRAWLRAHVATHAHGALGVARDVGVDEALIRRWLAGRYRDGRGNEYEITHIEIATVDRVLTRCETTDSIWTLYPDLEAPRRRRGGKPAGKYRLLTDDQVRAIHRVHTQGGVSLRELARQLHERYGYASAQSMTNCLSAAFDTLGLDARDRIESVRLTCTIHGLATREHRDREWARAGRVRRGEILDRPLCAALRVQYPRKGQPCGNRALADSEFCWAHDPRYAQLRVEILADARQRLHGTSA